MNKYAFLNKEGLIYKPSILKKNAQAFFRGFALLKSFLNRVCSLKNSKTSSQKSPPSLSNQSLCFQTIKTIMGLIHS